MADDAAIAAWPMTLSVFFPSENARLIDRIAPSEYQFPDRVECIADDARGYVQLLEDQQIKLIEGVQELYRRLRRGERWSGPEIAEDSQGYPLVQDVLDSLSLLASPELKNLNKGNETTTTSEIDEERTSQYEGSALIDSTSLPTTPPEDSQPSTASSPNGEYSQSRPSMSYITPQYQHLSSKATSAVPDPCTSTQMMQCLPLIADGTEYWVQPQPMTAVTTIPTPPMIFEGPVGQTNFSEFVNAFHTPPRPQDNGDWFTTGYTIM